MSRDSSWDIDATTPVGGQISRAALWQPGWQETRGGRRSWAMPELPEIALEVRWAAGARRLEPGDPPTSPGRGLARPAGRLTIMIEPDHLELTPDAPPEPGAPDGRALTLPTCTVPWRTGSAAPWPLSLRRPDLSPPLEDDLTRLRELILGGRIGAPGQDGLKGKRLDILVSGLAEHASAPLDELLPGVNGRRAMPVTELRAMRASALIDGRRVSGAEFLTETRRRREVTRQLRASLVRLASRDGLLFEPGDGVAALAAHGPFGLAVACLLRPPRDPSRRDQRWLLWALEFDPQRRLGEDLGAAVGGNACLYAAARAQESGAPLPLPEVAWCDVAQATEPLPGPEDALQAWPGNFHEVLVHHRWGHPHDLARSVLSPEQISWLHDWRARLPGLLWARAGELIARADAAQLTGQALDAPI